MNSAHSRNANTVSDVSRARSKPVKSNAVSANRDRHISSNVSLDSPVEATSPAAVTGVNVTP